MGEAAGAGWEALQGEQGAVRVEVEPEVGKTGLSCSQ